MPHENCRRFVIPCRLTMPFLAYRRHEHGIRKFDTKEIDGKKYFQVDVPQWRWAIKEALGSMSLIPEVDVDYIRIPTSILAPMIRHYERVWDKANPTKRETFECFQAGTVMSIPVFILSELEQSSAFNNLRFQSRPPTHDEVVECFKIIGEDIGLSPWGSKYGYGRFTVEK